jgi:putative PEP-CTERM system TPR-repeat lipoprotein
MHLLKNQYFQRKLVTVAVATSFFSSLALADYYQDAEESYLKGELNAAVIELKNSLQEDANNGRARLLLGRVYLQQGNLPAAEKELEKAGSLGVSKSELLLPTGQLKLRLSQNDEILNTLKPEDFENPEDIHNVFVLRGHALLAKNQIADAKEQFEQAQKHGESSLGLLGFARVSYLEKDLENSLSYIDRALAIEPTSKDVLFSKAQIFFQQKKIDEALAIYTQLIEQPGNNFSAQLARAEIYTSKHQLDEAKKDLARVLSASPMLPQANFMMARIQLEQRDYAGAQVSAEKVLRVVPNHPLSMFVLGAAHYDQENFEQARIHLESFVSKQPNHLIAARLLGATYLRMGEPTSAINFMEPIDGSLEINDALFLNILGRAYLQAGDFAKGTATLKRALDIDPELQGVRRQLAVGQFASGDSDDAIKELEKSYAAGDNSEQTSIMLILAYVKLGKFDAASELIRKSMGLYPKNAIFLSLTGISAEARKDKPAARKAYEQAVQLDPKYIPGLLSLAKLDLAEGNVEAAKTRYKSALQINDTHLQALLALAAISLKEGDAAAFVAKLEKARDGNPHAIAPVNLLAGYYLQQKNPEKALVEASRFETEHPDSIPALSLLSRVQIAQKDFAKAKYNLRTIIEKNPKDIKHRVQLAQILGQEKAYDESLVFLDEVIELQPNYIPAYLSKAVVFLNTRRYQEASAIADKMQELSPKTFLSEQLRGDIARAQGKDADAIAHYTRAFERAKTPYLANTLFQYHRQLKDFDRAIQVYSEYLVAAPKDNAARLKLATIYQQLGHNKEAIALYEMLYQQSPNNKIIVNNLAWMYWLENDDRSLEFARKAHRLSPDTPEIMDTFGWIMLHKGDAKEALGILQSAASRMPTNGDVRYHLALALSKNGKQAEARKELNRLLKNDQNFAEVESARALLKQLGE